MFKKKRLFHKKGIIIGIAAMAIPILGAAGYIWNLQHMKPPIACKDCNVIVISLDTLSGAHLPCYGYVSRNTAPNLCAFAEKNILFTHAYGNATYTLPGHVTMFTGLYPLTHTVMRSLIDRLPDKTLFLPSILKDHGYTNIFFMPLFSPHLPRDLVYNRGIDVFLDANNEPWSRALREFEQRSASGQKTFLFLHSYAVHPPFHDDGRPHLYTDDDMPWMNIRPADTLTVSRDFVIYLIAALRFDLINGVYKDGAFRYESLLHSLEKSEGDYEKQKRMIESLPDILGEYRLKYDPLIRIDINNQRELTYLQALYDQKIHELDEGPLRELMEFVSKDSVRNNTIVIITSDHGEEFGEHGYINHTTLYESNTRIVFVMAVPGAKSRRIIEYVQTADITPTILGLVGIQSGPFQGENLQKVLSGDYVSKRLIVAHMTGMQTLRFGKWKLFVDRRTAVSTPIELYDTEADPAESHNVLFSNMKFAKAIIAEYKQFEEKWAMRAQ